MCDYTTSTNTNPNTPLIQPWVGRGERKGGGEKGRGERKGGEGEREGREKGRGERKGGEREREGWEKERGQMRWVAKKIVWGR